MKLEKEKEIDSNFNLSHLLYEFIKTQPKIYITFYLLLFLAFPIEQVVFPRFYGYIIEAITDKTTTSSNMFSKIKKLCIILVIVLIVKQIMFVLLDYIDIHMLAKFESYVREKVIHNVLKKFEDNFKEIEVGELLSNIIKLPQGIRDIYHQIKNYVVPGLLVTIFATIVYYFFIDKKIAYVTLACMILFYVTTILFAKRCVKSSRYCDKLNNRLHEEIDDTVGNLLSVYTSNGVDTEKRVIKSKQTEYDKAYISSGKCAVTFKSSFSFVYLIVFVIINGYPLYCSYKNQINIGTLVTILFVNTYIIDNLEKFSAEIRVLIHNLGVFAENKKYLSDMFTTETMGVQKHHKRHFNKKLIVTDGNVLFKNITFQYTDSSPLILDNINLSVSAGQTVAIMGDIGSGKSTIIKLLLRLHDCTKGTIEVDNTPTYLCSPEEIRKHIGYVQQQPKLFNRTIYSNIIYGSNEKYWTMSRVQNKLNELKVNRLFENLPNGINTNVGKNGSNISGGQRQAIMLLRLAVSNKRILTLDEPTSALDLKNKEIVLSMIKQISKNRTCFIITHDEDALRYVDRVITFKKGKIERDDILQSSKRVTP